LVAPNPISSSPTQSKSKDSFRLQQWIEKYADLSYDLCESVLWSPSTANVVFKQTLQTWKSLAKNGEAFAKHERAFVLSNTVSILIPFAEKHGRKLNPSEQLMLDANYSPKERVDFLDSYLHRLSPRDQILLLLFYRYQLPSSEISTILREPEKSLELHCTQILESLRSWIWETSV